MPISFPSNPTTGQTYTYNNRTWIYNGSTWDTNSTTSVASAAAPITYNASTQTVGLDRTILPATPYTPALTLKPNTVQNSNLQEWQSNAGTILGAVDIYGNASFQNANYAGKNAIINGGMDIWQRGTSVTNGYPVYGADRWMAYGAGNATHSQQLTGDTATLPQIRYAQRIQRNSGSALTSPLYISQSVETTDSRRFSGNVVTLSWYARAGANFSATSNNMLFELAYGTGTDQNLIAGFTGQTNAASGVTALTTSWQRFTATGTIPNSANQVGVNLYYLPTGTAGANDYMEITGVQLELGSIATPFTRAGGNLQGEIAACQRYYQKTYNLDVAPGTNTQVGCVYTSVSSDQFSNALYEFRPFVTMRTTPAMTFYRVNGTINSWEWNRSGTSGTAQPIWEAGVYGGQNGGLIYTAVGTTYVSAGLKGHWIASAEL